MTISKHFTGGTMSKPTICLFSDTVCDANGVSRFIQDLAQSAKNRDVNLYVLTSTTKNYCKNLDNIINIKPMIRAKMPFYPELDVAFPNYFDLKRRASFIKPDMVVISTPGPVGLMGLRIANRMNIKKSAIYHTDFPSYIYDNTKSEMFKEGTNKFMRYFYKQFEKVYSRSAEYFEILKNDIKLPQDKLHILKAGTDTKSFHIKYRDSSFWENYPDINPTSIKLLYVGRLTKEKNFPFLLDTWENLKTKTDKNIELICCGEGKIVEKRDEWREKRVHLLGYKGGEELSKIYANSDIFLFPSVTDTLGQVVMEAQSSALPAIVSDIGGPQSIVKDKESGFVLPVSQDVWCEHIIRLLDDEELRKTMGTTGFNNMQENSFEITFDDFYKTNVEILQNEKFVIQSEKTQKEI